MKKQKSKITGEKSYIFRRVLTVFLVIIAVVVFIYLVLAVIVWFTTNPEKAAQNNKPNMVQLFIDENASDVNNLKRIPFADVYVVNGSLDVNILKSDADMEIKLLKDAVAEIESKENLSLTIEPEQGLLQEIEVQKNDSNYIYAVADYLGNKGFQTDVKYTEYDNRPGKMNWTECTDLYDKIEEDLQNANYCNVNSDCKTLPLGSMYMEFGCYHYINKNENSTTFYNRMNEYSVECGNLIDMCRASPEPRCVAVG